VMPGHPHLARCWQQLVEVAAPPCRVLALTVAMDLRPIEDRFDTLAHPACCFEPCHPEGGAVHVLLQHPHDKRRIDSLHRQRATDRLRISGERRLPLGGMLAITLARTVTCDVAAGAFVECYCLGSFMAVARRASIGSMRWYLCLRASYAISRASCNP